MHRRFPTVFALEGGGNEIDGNARRRRRDRNTRSSAAAIRGASNGKQKRRVAAKLINQDRNTCGTCISKDVEPAALAMDGDAVAAGAIATTTGVPVTAASTGVSTSATVLLNFTRTQEQRLPSAMSGEAQPQRKFSLQLRSGRRID